MADTRNTTEYRVMSDDVVLNGLPLTDLTVVNQIISGLEEQELSYWVEKRSVIITPWARMPNV